MARTRDDDGLQGLMKPLPVVALTDEDWSIWCRVMYRWPGGAVGRPAGGYYKADRRDAGIMLECRKRGAVVLFFEGTVLDWRFREVEWMPLYEL